MSELQKLAEAYGREASGGDELLSLKLQLAFVSGYRAAIRDAKRIAELRLEEKIDE